MALKVKRDYSMSNADGLSYNLMVAVQISWFAVSRLDAVESSESSPARIVRARDNSMKRTARDGCEPYACLRRKMHASPFL